MKNKAIQPVARESVDSTALFGIRPLKWEKTKNEYMEIYRASVPMGSYTVERNREDLDEGKPWEPWKMTYCFEEYYDEGNQECATLKEGKELAWQDWLKRITPALISMPNNPV